MTQFNEIRCDVLNCSIYSIPMCGKVNHSAREKTAQSFSIVPCCDVLQVVRLGGRARPRGGGGGVNVVTYMGLTRGVTKCFS